MVLRDHFKGQTQGITSLKKSMLEVSLPSEKVKQNKTWSIKFTVFIKPTSGKSPLVLRVHFCIHKAKALQFQSLSFGTQLQLRENFKKRGEKKTNQTISPTKIHTLLRVLENTFAAWKEWKDNKLTPSTQTLLSCFERQQKIQIMQ